MKKLFFAIVLLVQTNCVFSQSGKAARFIDSFVSKNNFNGTIQIKQKGKLTYNKSFGFANFPFKVPNTTDTKYRVASITKAFTAVLILQLYEQGKMDLDQTIRAYLPDYKGPAGNLVTVKQLLNMTSGIKNMDDGLTLESALRQGMPQYQIPYTSDQMLSKFCNDSLVAKPGTVFDYNNADFIILGKMIERVTGKTYEDNLREKIWQPLQMHHSGLMAQDKVIDQLADTYFYREDLKRLSGDLPVYWGNWYASGAMYSTPADIMAFSDALFSGKLLRQTTLDQMFTSGLGEYGYGVWVYKDYKINNTMYTIVKRPGSIMGAQAMLFHVLEDGSTVLILSNTGTVSLDDLAAKIADRIID